MLSYSIVLGSVPTSHFPDMTDALTGTNDALVLLSCSLHEPCLFARFPVRMPSVSSLYRT